MTQQTLVNPRWRYNAGGLDAMATQRRLIDGSATFEAGQFLRGATDGLLYTEASNSTSFQYLAMESVSTAIGADTTRKRVAVLRDSDVFEINVYHGTVASAVVTEAQIGLMYALYVASNICSLDISDTDNDAFVVVEPSWVQSPYIDASTDTYARTYASVLESVIDAARAS